LVIAGARHELLSCLVIIFFFFTVCLNFKTMKQDERRWMLDVKGEAKDTGKSVIILPYL